MATKIIALDDHFATGEPTVQLVSTWSRDGRVLHESTSLEKRATHSPAQDYIRNIRPEPGKSIVLVIGLGDHETYGGNRNGDGFPSEPMRGKIAADEVLTKHYKSYEKAHVFRHHANTDASKAIGRVKQAFWNPYMRRVELVEDFDNKRAPDLLEKIASGDFPAKSMGCRIKYDVCSNCANKAKTRAEYCDHLKYAMSQIDEHTGVQNCALNPSPDFFDSSWVLRPADRTGFMMKKVARDSAYEMRTPSYELGELVESLKEKSAALAKAADIEKILAGAPTTSVSNLTKSDASLVKKYQDSSKDAPKKDHKEVVRIMIAYKPSEAVGSADDAGLPLGIADLIKYFMGRMSPEHSDIAEDKHVTKAASDQLGLLLETFARYPRFLEDTLKLASLATLQNNPELTRKLAAYAPQNPTQDYFQRRMTSPSSRPNERGLTDLMSWTDPNTQETYQTNYGTVQKTNDALVRHGLMNNALQGLPMLGGSALLGAASIGMGMHPKTQGLPQLLAGAGALGLGVAGINKLTDQAPITGPKIQTDQGETISGWTEMVPKRASAAYAPELQYLMKRAQDSQPSQMPASAVEAYWAKVKTAELVDALTPIVGVTLDFEKMSTIVGQSLIGAA
jgi:hypothetical protein